MTLSDKEWYIVFVLSPSILSSIFSAAVVINVVRGTYKNYFFHQMSAVLGGFDILQCLGIFLDAPWLKDTCYTAAYLFLSGSLCKVMSIMYITIIITHVVIYVESPSRKRKLIYSFIGILCAILSTIMLTVHGVAEVLCYDPDPVTFNYNEEGIEDIKRRMFFAFYAMPISVLFFAIMFLTFYSMYCLRIMVKKGQNRAMIRLIRRLIPLSTMFFIVFIPTAVFFLRGYITEHENYTNKTIAILGQVLSGTFYAICYFYACYVDHTYVATATKRLLEAELAMSSSMGERRSSIVSDRFSIADDADCFAMSSLPVNRASLQMQKSESFKNSATSEI